MPISKERQSRYPGGSIQSKEWRAIRFGIMERSGGSCEKCGVDNHSTIVRMEEGTWLPVDQYDATFGQGESKGREVKIVLTISHYDHNPGNNDPANLRALCQRCHLDHDLPRHRRNRYWNRKRHLAGGNLFEE